MDFAQLRSTVLASDTQRAESVAVNQRHLIDKLLARYCQDHTVFRELLQNSNDACASRVAIDFVVAEAAPSSWFSNAQHCITHVVYRNNGKPFSPADWTRLKNIAEGNPDETKIGFFGVGFYSLFSICEEPFVVSGNESMAFFWQGDMLYTKKGPAPPATTTQIDQEHPNEPSTVFYLELRQPIALPNLSEFARFLSTSLAFTVNLRDVVVRLQGRMPTATSPTNFIDVLRISKTLSQPEDLPLAYIPESSTLSRILGGQSGKLLDAAKEQSSGLLGRVIRNWFDSGDDSTSNSSSKQQPERQQQQDEAKTSVVEQTASTEKIVDPVLSCVRFAKQSPNKLFTVKRVFTRVINVKVFLRTQITLNMAILSNNNSKSKQHFEDKTVKLASRSKYPDIGVERPSGLDEDFIFQEMSMRCVSMDVTSSLPEELHAEMVRVTKKPPPKEATLSAIYTNVDEFKKSLTTTKGERIVSRSSAGFLNFNFTKEEAVILAPLLPDPEESISENASGRMLSNNSNSRPVSDNEQGCIYIGFPTFQTTGTSLQFVAPFIPTVERESIDFVDKTLKIWNIELLSTIGYLARIVYEEDMLSVRKELLAANIHKLELGNGLKSQEDTKKTKWAIRRAVHCMAAFSFPRSTPSPVVGDIISTAFRASCKLVVNEKDRNLVTNGFVARKVSEDSSNKQPLDILPPHTELEDAISCISCDGITGSRKIRIMSGFDRRVLNMNTNDNMTPFGNASRDVLQSNELTPLLKTTVYLQPEINSRSARFVSIIKAGNMGFNDFGLNDLISEFKSRSLNKSEFVLFIKWWTSFREEVLDYDDGNLLVGGGRYAFMDSDVQQQAAFVRRFVDDILRTLTIEVPTSSGGIQRVIISEIKYYVKPHGLPDDSFVQRFLPTSVLPVAVSSLLSQKELMMGIIRGAWTEFKFTNLVGAISAGITSIGKDVLEKEFIYEKTLFFFAKNAGNLSTNDKNDILSKLSRLECVPTTQGYKIPSDAYFTTVDLFEDLPTINFGAYLRSPVQEDGDKVTENPWSKDAVSSKNRPPVNVERVLKMLGVREHVDLEVVFARLDSLKWDQINLIKYLATVHDKLSKSEWNRLRSSKFLISEAQMCAKRLSNGSTGESTSEERHEASKFYFPSDDIRKLVGSKRILGWTLMSLDEGDENSFKSAPLRIKSVEHDFLTMLGVMQHIDASKLAKLLNKVASSTPIGPIDNPDTKSPEMEIALTRVSDILTYYRRHADKFYQRTPLTSLSIQVPCLQYDRVSSNFVSIFCSPQECCSDSNLSIFQIPYLHPSISRFATDLGVVNRPSGAVLARQIVRFPPENREVAEKMFGMMLKFATELSGSDIDKLAKSKIVPIETMEGDKKVVTLNAPRDVYIGIPKKDVYKTAFSYISFSNVADSFLQLIGAKVEPSLPDLCAAIMSEPVKYWGKFGTEQYLEILRNVGEAISMEGFKRFDKTAMMTQRWLVGVQRFSEEDNVKENTDVSQDGTTNFFGSLLTDTTANAPRFEYTLACAKDIYLLDNEVFSKLFNPLGCPQEFVLEQLYASLGSSWISNVVSTTFQVVNYDMRSEVTRRQCEASSLQLSQLIKTRLPLLLHDDSSMAGSRSKRSNLRNDANEYLLSLDYQPVDDIRVHHKFGKLMQSQSTSSYLYREQRKNPILYFTITKFDFFDLARELGKLIYVNSRLAETLYVETVLSESLEKLNRKGFQVERLLKLQEQNKVASEKKMKEMQEKMEKERQEKERQENERLEKERLAEDERKRENEALLLNQQQQQESRMTKSKGEVSSSALISSGLDGFEGRSSTSSKLSGMFKDLVRKRSKDIPPEMLTTSKGGGGSSLSSSSTDAGTMQQRPTNEVGKRVARPEEASRKVDEMVGSMSQFANSLSEAMKKSNNIPSSVAEINARYPNESETIGRTRDVGEGSCRALADNDLVLFKVLNGVRLYLDKRVLSNDTEAELLGYDDTIAVQFIVMLKTMLQHVFGLGESSSILNVFWDRSSPVVAFNRSRTLFFNLGFFVSAGHSPGVTFSLDANDVSDGRVLGTHCVLDVASYWFMTICHELAHNFVGPHNEQHGFWMSALATRFMPRLIAAYAM